MVARPAPSRRTRRRLIEIDPEPLPPVLDPRAGLEPGAPRARLDCPDNLVARHLIEYGDVDGAFAKAEHRFADALPAAQGRRPCASKTRGMVVRFDPVEAR